MGWGSGEGFPIDMAWGFAEFPGAEASEVIAGGEWGVWGESGESRVREWGRERESA